MNTADLKDMARIALITIGVLLAVRALFTQIGYGLTKGRIAAAHNAERKGLL
jgi:Na+-translocating ferredoxin:NAD+ oxidoreductase RnfG subunit